MFAPGGTLAHCVTWTWTSARTHLACTRASVSTHAAASNASVAPDTQVTLFHPPVTWRSILESQKAYRDPVAARYWGNSDANLALSKKINEWKKAPPHNGWLLISPPASRRYRTGFSARLTREKFVSFVQSDENIWENVSRLYWVSPGSLELCCLTPVHLSYFQLTQIKLFQRRRVCTYMCTTLMLIPVRLPED